MLLWALLFCEASICICNRPFSPVNLSFVNLICRAPDTRLKRVEEKVSHFLPPPISLEYFEFSRKIDFWWLCSTTVIHQWQQSSRIWCCFPMPNQCSTSVLWESLTKPQEVSQEMRKLVCLLLSGWVYNTVPPPQHLQLSLLQVTSLEVPHFFADKPNLPYLSAPWPSPLWSTFPLNFKCLIQPENRLCLSCCWRPFLWSLPFVFSSSLSVSFRTHQISHFLIIVFGFWCVLHKFIDCLITVCHCYVIVPRDMFFSPTKL